MVVLGMIVVADAAAREVHAQAKDAPFFLMLLATLSLTLFAIGRLPFPIEALAWLLYALCLFVPVIIDTARNHRLHPAFGWGAPAVFVSLYVVRQLASTPAWMHFAERLVS